ncbi:glycosyltransferase [Candidatus Pelagibacter sp.]|nr:glycosyltransferase [Candidatus Pelagibacter sp.]
MTYQKNFECLIEGVKNLKKKYPNFLLLIIGSGELLSKLQKKIDIYNLNKNIKLTGFIKNPYIFYKYSDLYISSSRWEEPGHTLIEAAYYKTPIITSDCLNGPKEIFRDKSGIMFNNNDSNDLSKKINLFLSLNKNKKLKMVNQAYKKTKTYKEKYFYSEMLKILK